MSKLDKDRYATVYEDKKLQESVAAPTAGLHFDEELLDSIKKIGVNFATINLSVGAGTFQPVKVENIKDHDIHEEYLEVKKNVVELVNQTKKSGKKVFAVGTTATRALETAFLRMAMKMVIKDIQSYLYILVLSLRQLIDS